MNTEPDFRHYIAAAKREAAERAAALELERQTQQSAKQRAQAAVLDLLYHVVQPQLAAAQQQLCADEITADIANGQDAHGSMRRSLRISRDEHSSMLVFTAVHLVPVPFLGVHTETLPKPGGPLPEPIQDTSLENITRIIGEFIKQAFV